MALILIGAMMAIPAAARRTVAQKKQAARTQFENAERMREALNGRDAAERTRRDYNLVIDAYRAVYYTAPTSNRADAGVVAVAELLAEVGRQFHEERSLRAAIAQYEFLRREYPGSRYRASALFTIAQIYKDDLEDTRQARATFDEFLKRYPQGDLAAEARAALRDLDPDAREAKTPKPKPGAKPAAEEAPPPVAGPRRRILVTGIRHWSTPDYTRVAIDLQDGVQFETGRVPNPDRVFFDLHNTHLSSTLVGKSFEVEDGFLHKIRVAQYQVGETRVVLELDEIAEYSAFLLPNPYRLIIDVHGKHPQKMAKSQAQPAPRESGPPARAAVARDGAVEAEKPAGKSAPEPAKPKTAPAIEVARKGPLADNKRATTATQESAGDKKDKESASALAVPAARKPTFDELSQQVAKLNPPPEIEATSTPVVSDVTPVLKASKETAAASGKRGKASAVKKQPAPPVGHEAQPTANGERSLIRALGLKIGRIVVDAGHGGHDTGTIGPNGLMEKELVLDVALRLGKLLESRLGAEVIYTRDDDTFIPLETRTAIANKNEADLFISVHANSSSDTAARGVETYYLNFTTSADALEVAARENAVSEKSIHELQDLVKKIALKDKIEESREFAVDVQQSLYKGLASHGLRNRGVKKAPFIVLIGANMPSILAEISFVSNPADAKRLKTPEYRRKIAEALYRGTAKYVSGLSGLKVASKATKPETGPVSSAGPTRSAPASSTNE